MQCKNKFNKNLAKTCASIGLLLAATTSQIQADEYHYINMLIGDRASGLAGSYVSISDDPSGLYYNPAGIVYSSASNISANMNAYNVSRTVYKNVLGNTSWVRTSSALVPNYFGITQPLGPGTLGFSYAVTDSILEDQDQTFKDLPSPGAEFTMNFNNQDTTNNIGPSYAININEKFSIGLTMYGYYRSQERIINQTFEFPDETIVVSADPLETKTVDYFHTENLYVTKSEYGIKPILGIMYSPIPKISLGATITKVFLLSSEADAQSTKVTNYLCVDDTTNESVICDDASFIRASAYSTYRREMPWEINIGGTWFVSNRLLLTGSAWIYEAINGTDKPLVNAAGGLEYYLTGKWAIRMGGYTNMANTPKVQTNKSSLEHVNILGATLSVSHFTRTSSITLGATGNYGRGQAQVIDGSNKIQDVEYLGLSVYISASNSF